MTLLLVRHAESEANLDESLFKTMGDHHIALSKCGHKQAAKLGEFINNFFQENKPSGKVRLWASPYLRTTQTAEGLYRNAPHVPWEVTIDNKNIFFDDRLREREFGYFDGLDDKQIATEYPREWKHYQKQMQENGKYYARPAGGESAADVCVRLHTFYETLWRDIKSGKKDHVIVNHGFTLRCFVNSFFHRHPEEFIKEKNPENTAVRLLQINEENGRYQDKGYIYKPSI